MLHNQLAQLKMHLGDRDAASAHARIALPVMQRLGATDDEVQLRSLLALCAVAEDRLEDAERELDQVDRLDEREATFGGTAFREIGRAEVALARGDAEAGLRVYRKCAGEMRELTFPGSLSDRARAVDAVRRFDRIDRPRAARQRRRAGVWEGVV